MKQWAQAHVHWTNKSLQPVEFYHICKVVLKNFAQFATKEHGSAALLVLQLAAPSNDGSPFLLRTRQDADKGVVKLFAPAGPVFKPVHLDAATIATKVAEKTTRLEDIAAALADALHSADRNTQQKIKSSPESVS